jgi:hypothetical protein
MFSNSLILLGRSPPATGWRDRLRFLPVLEFTHALKYGSPRIDDKGTLNLDGRSADPGEA